MRALCIWWAGDPTYSSTKILKGIFSFVYSFMSCFSHSGFAIGNLWKGLWTRYFAKCIFLWYKSRNAAPFPLWSEALGRDLLPCRLKGNYENSKYLWTRLILESLLEKCYVDLGDYFFKQNVIHTNQILTCNKWTVAQYFPFPLMEWIV